MQSCPILVQTFLPKVSQMLRLFKAFMAFVTRILWIALTIKCFVLNACAKLSVSWASAEKQKKTTQIGRRTRRSDMVQVEFLVQSGQWQSALPVRVCVFSVCPLLLQAAWAVHERHHGRVFTPDNAGAAGCCHRPGNELHSVPGKSCSRENSANTCV